MTLDEILNATYFSQICKSDDEYKQMAKLLHPDRCNDTRANDALVHLNNLRDEAERGLKFNDESGEYSTTGFIHTWYGDQSLLKASYDNYNTLVKSLKNVYQDDENSLKHFMQYIPHNYSFKDNKLSFTTDLRCVPLSKMITKLMNDPLKYKHCNWVFSRLIEFCSLLESIGYAHNGLSPNSVFVIPETHGITVTTFFHSQKFGEKLKTLNGINSKWYPDKIFKTKLSKQGIDVILSKKLTISNMGDPSGSGVILRANKEINNNVLSFMMKSDNDTEAFGVMKEWRSILEKNFEKKFYQLNV